MASNPERRSASEWLWVTPAGGQRNRPAAAARWSNLLCSPWEDVGQQWRMVWVGWLGASSASMAMGSGDPPAKPRAPAWASFFGDPSGMINLARAVPHRCGGELTR
jgi:hypothetical protein